MGNTTTTTSTSQQAQPTEQEKQQLQQQIDWTNFTMPYQKTNYADLSQNIQAILEGKQPMAQGVGGITDAQTQNMVTAGLRSLYPQFQSAGIMDSGEAISAATRSAADIANQNAQFNVSAAQNLFNLASGGQSNLQAQAQASTNNLSNQLAGLRSYSGTSSTSQNPFLNSFYSSMGTGIGKGAAGAANGFLF